ncbi:hypothetical protein T265_05462 [Opisthorchis viverrini]|uniref:Uncharacterized protein n=1 Tax=Opisthorchis viverrini TaxID=6198 RepID=A0A074ZKC5_OPIVI|nr:hypothetical protein T265_05462 [Opisthorchis viverrini]KER27501.1 hypothetical protein T265_05462 [Opisthorchis viverrini]
MKETTHKVAENSWTAHDRFRPSWNSSGRRDLSAICQPCVLLEPKVDRFGQILAFIYELAECAAPGYLMFQSLRYSRYRDTYICTTLLIRLLRRLSRSFQQPYEYESLVYNVNQLNMLRAGRLMF